MSYLKNRWSKTDCLMKFLDDSAWFCMEKLKKHNFETKKLKHHPKIIKILQKSLNKIPSGFPFYIVTEGRVQGPLQGPSKEIFRIFYDCLYVFGQMLCLFVSKLCFLSFSMQNHAESSGNYIKNSILDHLFFE